LPSEASLLERIRQYETAALAQVYDDYYERIYRYTYRYLGQADAAEDLTANVFFRLLNSVRNGRSPRKNLAAWLYRVAHNLVVDTFRRRPAEELELAEWLESHEPDLMRTVEQRLQMHRVRLALRQLTESQQQVIVLKFLEGMNSREVATILGKTEGAVDALQHRALVALRKALGPGQGPSVESQTARGKQNEMGHKVGGHGHTSMVGTLVLRRLLALLRLSSLRLSRLSCLSGRDVNEVAEVRLAWEVER